MAKSIFFEEGEWAKLSPEEKAYYLSLNFHRNLELLMLKGEKVKRTEHNPSM